MGIMSLNNYLKLYFFISQKYLQEFESRWMSVDSNWFGQTVSSMNVMYIVFLKVI